jgi:hypothetical protein
VVRPPVVPMGLVPQGGDEGQQEREEERQRSERTRASCFLGLGGVLRMSVYVVLVRRRPVVREANLTADVIRYQNVISRAGQAMARFPRRPLRASSVSVIADH